MGHLDEQDILRLTSVLKRVKEIATNDKNLTQDIDDALHILNVNTKENIIIPNVSHRRKVYNRYHLEETTKQNMMQEQAKKKYPDSSSLVSFAVNLHSYSEQESQTILRKIVSSVPIQLQHCHCCTIQKCNICCEQQIDGVCSNRDKMD